MNAPSPECPVCRVRMAEGHVLQQVSSGRRELLRWTDGAPEKSALSGFKVKGRKQLDVEVFRCPSCGWLIWFAPDAAP